jgi:hypothetical protein
VLGDRQHLYDMGYHHGLSARIRRNPSVHATWAAGFRFIELAAYINNRMPAYVVQRLLLAFNSHESSLKGARVLLLGLALQGEHE